MSHQTTAKTHKSKANLKLETTLTSAVDFQALPPTSEAPPIGLPRCPGKLRLLPPPKPLKVTWPHGFSFSHPAEVQRAPFPAKKRHLRLISSLQLERNPCFAAASEQAGKVIVSPSTRFNLRPSIYCLEKYIDFFFPNSHTVHFTALASRGGTMCFWMFNTLCVNPGKISIGCDPDRHTVTAPPIGEAVARAVMSCGRGDRRTSRRQQNIFSS